MVRLFTMVALSQSAFVGAGHAQTSKDTPIIWQRGAAAAMETPSSMPQTLPAMPENKLDFASTNPPILNDADIAAQAETDLYSGRFYSAENLFRQLAEKNTPDYTLYAQYGLAVSQSQQGNFEQALATLLPLVNSDSDYREKARDLRAELLLRLMTIDILKQDNTAKEAHFQDLSKNHGQHKAFETAERLLTIENAREHAANTQEQNVNLRVGLLLPLSGPLAAAGADMLRAAQLALFDYAGSGVLLYPEDTQGTPEGAKEAMENVIRHGADVVLGPLLAENVRATEPLATQGNMPQISFSSDVSVAGSNTFLLSYPPQEQAQQIARHAFEQGKRKFALFVPNTPYGIEMADYFKVEVAALGGEVVRSVTFSLSDTDYSKPLTTLLQLNKARNQLKAEKTKLEKEYAELAGAMDDASLSRLNQLKNMQAQALIDFDALFIPAPAASMPLIASQLAYFDVDASGVMLLGTALWDVPSFKGSQTEYMHGGRFTAPESLLAEHFNNIFEKTYTHKPHPLAPLAYDALRTISTVFQMGNTSARDIRSALTQPTGFAGVSGAYSFYDNGQIHRIYTIKELGQQSRVVQQAPWVMPPALPASLQGKRSFFNFGSSNTTAPQTAPQPQQEEKKKGGWFWW